MIPWQPWRRTASPPAAAGRQNGRKSSDVPTGRLFAKRKLKPICRISTLSLRLLTLYHARRKMQYPTQKVYISAPPGPPAGGGRAQRISAKAPGNPPKRRNAAAMPGGPAAQRCLGHRPGNAWGCPVSLTVQGGIKRPYVKTGRIPRPALAILGPPGYNTGTSHRQRHPAAAFCFLSICSIPSGYPLCAVSLRSQGEFHGI